MNLPAPGQAQLPRGVRVAAVLCAFLCSFVGAFAGSDAMRALGWGERLPPPPSQRALLAQESAQVVAAFERMQDTALATIREMRTSRSLTLGLLSVSCALAFVASLRLLRPAGLRREGARRTLVFALLMSALLRTVDGAQHAVVVQRQVRSGLQALQLPPAPGDAPAAEAAPVVLDPAKPDLAAVLQVMLPTYLPVSVAFTALMVAAFALMAQLFRSDRLRKLVEELDERDARGAE